jgi:asparagine synthase (glutamine-hydrolysing)
MCGIAGIILKNPQIVPDVLINELADKIRHRGPDDSGFLTLGNGPAKTSHKYIGDANTKAVLIHQRLSIIDLSEGGWQPMGNQDKSKHIVFNGEIYNFIELRKELSLNGSTFKSESDTEVLLSAWDTWGESAINRLTGMFAFSVLDTNKRTLTLVRDFFGIKPLYYTWWQEGFAFSSEITPLLELPGVTRNINPKRVFEYLRFGRTDHGGETLFEDIHQVPAGHLLKISLDDPFGGSLKEYWSPKISETSKLSFSEASEKLRDMFIENVRMHLRSDVPVGSALSGGIDSSSIVSTIRKVEPNAEIHAFGYVPDDKSISEEKWMELAASSANAHLHKDCPEPANLLSEIDELIKSQEEPFGSISIFGQRRVFKLAKENGIKVMLDGQGADETMAGYRYYLGSRAASLARGLNLISLASFVSSANKMPGTGRFAIILDALRALLPNKIQSAIRILFRREIVPAWLNVKWFKDRGIIPEISGFQRGKNALKTHLIESITKSSLPHLLRYEDRNSMAFSIESRVPFLTPQIVDFLLSLPEEYLISSKGISKTVFRNAMRGLVPDQILDRKDKIGFAAPNQNWLKKLDGWVTGAISSQTANKLSFFNIPAMHKSWEATKAGKQGFDLEVWRWVNFIKWAEHFRVTEKPGGELTVVHMTSNHPAFDNRILQKECRSASEGGYRTTLIPTGTLDCTAARVHIEGSGPDTRGSLLKMLKRASNIRKKAARIPASIYHFHDPELIPSGLIMLLSGKKVIYDMHEDLPRHFVSSLSNRWKLPRPIWKIIKSFIGLFEQVVARLFTAIVPATPAISARFSRIKKAVVQNFPRLESLPGPSGIPWNSREFAVGYHGSIAETRGAIEMVQATEYFKTGKLLLAGNYSPSKLRERLSGLSAWGNVEELGFLDWPSIMDMLKRIRAGLVVLHPDPKYQEAYPVKMFEFMAAGVPVIASDFPLWREIVGGAKCGILVDPKDPKAIGQAVSRLLNDHAEAEEMGLRGRKAVLEKYNWGMESEKLLELYDVISGKTPA